MDAKSGLVYATSTTVGKGTRFVTSFLNLEDKVILRQVAKYLRKTFDSGAPRAEISGKSVAARRGGNKYSPNCASLLTDRLLGSVATPQISDIILGKESEVKK